MRQVFTCLRLLAVVQFLRADRLRLNPRGPPGSAWAAVQKHWLAESAASGASQSRVRRRANDRHRCSPSSATAPSMMSWPAPRGCMRPVCQTDRRGRSCPLGKVRREGAIRTLGPAQAEVNRRIAMRGQKDTRRLGGDQRWEIGQVVRLEPRLPQELDGVVGACRGWAWAAGGHPWRAAPTVALGPRPSLYSSVQK